MFTVFFLLISLPVVIAFAINSCMSSVWAINTQHIFLQHRTMADNHQRPVRSTQRHAKHQFHLNPQASQSSTTDYDLVRAAMDEGFIAPEFCPQFNGTYPQLEVSEHEKTPVCAGKAFLEPNGMTGNQGTTTAPRTPWTTTPDKTLECRSESSFVTIKRPWEEQILGPPATGLKYSDQAQTPLAVWESQTSVEEPFNNVGEVAARPARRQEEERSDRNRRREGRRTRRGN